MLTSSMPQTNKLYISPASAYKKYETQPHILYHGEIVTKTIPTKIAPQATPASLPTWLSEQTKASLVVNHQWNCIESFDLRLAGIRGEIIHKVLEICVGVKPPTPPLISNISHNMLIANNLCFFNQLDGYDSFIQEIEINVSTCWSKFKDLLEPRSDAKFYKELENLYRKLFHPP